MPSQNGHTRTGRYRSPYENFDFSMGLGFGSWKVVRKDDIDARIDGMSLVVLFDAIDHLPT